MPRVDDTAENAERCICPDCPTFNDCMREARETLFCARGMTNCEARTRECICPDCVVWTDYQLGTTYFCLEGAAE